MERADNESTYAKKLLELKDKLSTIPSYTVIEADSEILDTDGRNIHVQLLTEMYNCADYESYEWENDSYLDSNGSPVDRMGKPYELEISLSDPEAMNASSSDELQRLDRRLFFVNDQSVVELVNVDDNLVGTVDVDDHKAQKLLSALNKVKGELYWDWDIENLAFTPIETVHDEAFTKVMLDDVTAIDRVEIIEQ